LKRGGVRAVVVEFEVEREGEAQLFLDEEGEFLQSSTPVDALIRMDQAQHVRPIFGRRHRLPEPRISSPEGAPLVHGVLYLPSETGHERRARVNSPGQFQVTVRPEPAARPQRWG